MYFLKINKKKRFATVNKRYARRARLKKITIFLTALTFAAGAFLLWQNGKDYIENIKMPSFLIWQIKQINIQAPTEKLKTKIEKYLAEQQIKISTPLTKEQAKELEIGLNENIKYVKDIQVKRKIFTKELLIKAEKFTPYIKVLIPGGEFFMTEEGRLFQDNDPQNKGGFLNVFLNAKIKEDVLAQELVQFIKELKTAPFKIDDVLINIEGQTAEFETDFGPVKLRGFKEVKQQLSVLAEIFKIAQGKKFKLPYFVDFTYFDKGKVYLKQNYKDL